jgi:hypothetical protein
MTQTTILSKVYGSSSIVIMTTVLLACLVCRWPLWMIAIALLASMIIGSPSMLSLQLLVWLVRGRSFQKSFAWMLLLASVPPFAFIAAWLFADFVPGKVWLLLLMGMASGYVGILTNGISITQLFNSIQYEREENDTIN